MWTIRKKLLGALGEAFAFDYVWPEVVVRNTHVFYAVMSAYTGFLWARKAWDGAGDLARGEATPIAEAAKALGDLWIDDGWIFCPTEG